MRQSLFNLQLGDGRSCFLLYFVALYQYYHLRGFRSFAFCFSLQRWRLHHASKSFIRWSYSAAALAQRSNFRCAGSRRKKSNSSEMFGNCIEAQTLLPGFHCFSPAFVFGLNTKSTPAINRSDINESMRFWAAWLGLVGSWMVMECPAWDSWIALGL